MDFDDEEFDDDEYDFDNDEEEDEYSEEEVIVAKIEKEAESPKLVELCNSEDVFQYLKEILTELNNITNLPKVSFSHIFCPKNPRSNSKKSVVSILLFKFLKTVLRVLLNDFKWDKGRFLERFYEDPTRLLRGITCSQPLQNCPNYFDCEICMLDFPTEESVGMSHTISYNMPYISIFIPVCIV